MAIYHLSAKIVRRSDERNVVAAASYRSGERLNDPVTHQTFDYSRKQAVIHQEILAPREAPTWVFDRQKLWASVEKRERRKDSQLAREIELSLPCELNLAQRIALARRFILEEFVALGMVGDLCFHAPGWKNDEKNHHLHALLTMRHVSKNGWGNKNRSWNEPSLLLHWRRRWAEMANLALKEAGSTARIDHRSYLERGIQRRPSPTLGIRASNMERRGISTNRKVEQDQQEIPVMAGALRFAHVGQRRRCFELFADDRYRQWMPPALVQRITQIDIQEDVRVHMTGGEVATVTDQRVGLAKGDNDGIALLLATAAALNWSSIALFGPDDFVAKAAEAAIRAGLPVSASDPAQSRIVLSVATRLRRSARLPTVNPRARTRPGHDRGRPAAPAPRPPRPDSAVHLESAPRPTPDPSPGSIQEPEETEADNGPSPFF